MPTLIMTNLEDTFDGSIKAKALTFLLKLSTDDTLPGLHIEPIQGAADPRVRTGRVDQFWRAVLFRLDSGGERHYVVHGVWPHDAAAKIAQQTRLRVNPINGLPQFELVAGQTAGGAMPAGAASWAAVTEPELPSPVSSPSPASSASPSLLPVTEPALPSPVSSPSPSASPPVEPLLTLLGRTRADLVDRLGIPADVADLALAAPDEDALLALATRHEGWLGLLLVQLGTADPIDDIVTAFDLSAPPAGDLETDATVLESFQRPAARTQFTFVEGQDELRRVIETGDLGAWRVFLHPEQRRFVDRDYNGPARVSGGAGTGKTVVLVHRARRLATGQPTPRIVLTTFTTNLADSMRDLVTRLDPRIPLARQLGDDGIHVAGIDAIAAAVIRDAHPHLGDAVAAVVGEARSAVNSRTPAGRWREILANTTSALPGEIANETFLRAEYDLIVLPNRITTEEGYLRARRPGRGVALNRARRAQVWSLFAAYRAQARIDGTVDFAEAAAIAAWYLDGHPDRRPADHVLVDETQDLTPPQLQLIRALARPGRNDLFLTEDSHQRIYGPGVVLGRCGIKIVGRSRRLTLNYRTTAQNLRYAMALLDGGEYVDLDGEPEATGYRSARTGPEPTVVDAPSLDGELAAIVERVRRWLDADTPPESIAVLTPDRYQRDRVTNRLAEAGVAARAVDRSSAPADRVAVLTMHRAKGMEFAKVIVTDVDYRSAGERARLDAMDPSERSDAELRMRSLHYVAATRARDELVVLRRA